MSPSSDVRCAQSSRDRGESLYGTAASEVTVWLLLEHRGTWGHKTVQNNDLPDEVNAWFDRQVQALGSCRRLFIRRPSSEPAQGPLSFYVGLAEESRRSLHHVSLDDVTDLLDLDVEAILGGDARYAPYVSSEQLTLVCANKEHDRCCGRGLALSRALGAAGIGEVWEATHLGGHRFAPTAVILPDGIYYGRLDSMKIEDLVATIRDRRIALDLYRGRTCYSSHVQAAEAYLREETGEFDLDAFVLRGATSSDGDGQYWQVRFANARGADVHTVHLGRTLTEEPVPVSCGEQGVTEKTMARYHLRGIETA